MKPASSISLRILKDLFLRQMLHAREEIFSTYGVQLVVDQLLNNNAPVIIFPKGKN